MKFKAEVTDLSNCGDYVAVKCQGTGVADADWRPWLSWELKVREHTARKWTIGTRLEIVVSAKP